MKFFLLTLFILVLGPIRGVERQKVEGEVEAIGSLIQQLDKRPISEFSQFSDEYRKKILSFIEKKRKVCDGEFTSVILTDVSISSDHVAKKLTREEKEACFQELKVIHLNFLRKYHSLRVKYMKWVQEQRLKSMDEAYKTSIEDLEKSYKRAGRRRRL